jgi:hypothetical protein
LPGKPHTYGYCYIHSNGNCYSNIHAYSYSHLYAYIYSDVYPYPNSDCYSGKPDSDANMHAGRDLVRHFERFWYTGG